MYIYIDISYIAINVHNINGPHRSPEIYNIL